MKLAYLKVALFTGAMCSLLGNNAVASSKEVALKCEIVMSGLSQHHSVIKEIPLKREAATTGVVYRFDEIVTFEESFQPDVVIRIRGHYFKDQSVQRKQNSFMRFASTFCHSATGSADVSCYGEKHSEDVFIEKVTRKSAANLGRTVLSRQTAGQIKFPKDGIDILMNYRLKHGHDMLEDIARDDYKGQDAYRALITPVTGVTCSVRDDDLGIVHSYEFDPKK